MKRYFTAGDVIKELDGFEAQSMVFSMNGMRVFVNVDISTNKVKYVVEEISTGKTDDFNKFSAAMIYAENKQKAGT